MSRMQRVDPGVPEVVQIVADELSHWPGVRGSKPDDVAERERATAARLLRKCAQATRDADRAALPVRKPVAAQSAKRKAERGPRAARMKLLREAQDGRCARCCRWFGSALHGHELVGMAQGGDYKRPDVALCDPCNAAIEDEPAASAWNGWKINGHPRNPSLPEGTARNVLGDDFVFATDAELGLSERRIGRTA